MINKRGVFAKHEILTVLTLLLIIFAFLLGYILKIRINEKYLTMSYSAKKFASSVMSSEDFLNNGDGTYYLSQMIDMGSFDEIKSPFSNNNCDVNESKVEISGNKKYITLKCDNYLINQQNYDSNVYNIYKVGKWSSTRRSSSDQNIIGYNYKVNGQLVFSDYFEVDCFLYLFNKKNDTNYKRIEDIPEKYKIIKERLYRRLKLVSTKKW